MLLDNNFIISVLPHAEILQGFLKERSTFSVDSRTLQEGDIFIALKGNVTDGHAFLKDALLHGASGLIIEKSTIHLLKTIPDNLLKNKFILAVEDTMQDLITLAHAWRKQLTMPVIGITGSVGKTSTKELLYQVLAAQGKKVYATKGNQNTLIGISLNLLHIDNSYDYVICEMGIQYRGEMAKLADLVNPTFGVVTYIGHAHMAGLGLISEIANEKRQIFKNYKEQQIGVINGDQPMLSMISYNHPILKFGLKTTNQIQARKIEINENTIDFILKIYDRKYKIHLNTNNEACINNILAVTSLAVLLGVPDAVIIQAIQQPITIKGRFNSKLIKNNWGRIIDDCYNANPESMKSAILAFEKIMCTGLKIAVLGDMNELGAESAFWHRQVGRFLRKAPSINHLILVGHQIKYTGKTIPVNLKFDLVESWQDCLEILMKILEKEKDSLVLVKGSTGGYKNGLVNIIKNLAVDDSDVADVSLIAATKHIPAQQQKAL